LGGLPEFLADDAVRQGPWPPALSVERDGEVWETGRPSVHWVESSVVAGIFRAVFENWDVLHPFWEHLARQFGLPVVEVMVRRDNETSGWSFPVYLNSRQHVRERAYYTPAPRGVRSRRRPATISGVLLRQART